MSDTHIELKAMEEAGKRKLRRIEREEVVDCYTCAQPAKWVKEMQTPSGGSYLRGWCTSCLVGIVPGAVAGRQPAKSNRDFRVPIGSKVVVHFEGKLLSRYKDDVYSVTVQNEEGQFKEYLVPGDSVEVR